MSNQSHSQSAPGFSGIPLSLALTIVFAAATTGLLLSILFHGIGWPFLITFLIAAVAMTLFVEARSLFLTVAPLPVLFAVFAFLTSWAVNVSAAPEGTGWFTRTMLWTSIYPIVEMFPPMAWMTVLTVIIAVVRVVLLRRHARQIEARRQRQRQNLKTADRAREHTNRVTVEELMARNRADSQTTSPIDPDELPRSRRNRRL